MLKVLLIRICPVPQELVEVILFFSDPGDAGTLCIYPEQVSALPKEKRGGWEKRWLSRRSTEIFTPNIKQDYIT